MKDWFLEARGIKPDTLSAFGVELTGNEAKFSYGDDLTKIRKHDADGKRHFRYEGAFRPTLFSQPDAHPDTVAFLVEGETDAMRLWQELRESDSNAWVVGLPGVEHWVPEMAEGFRHMDSVYVILDNDQDYNVQGRVDTAWRNIRMALGPKAVRLKLPKEVKDVCEFFGTYDVDTLRLMAEAAPTEGLHYEAFNLSKKPDPPDWLVNNLFALGDRAVMIGEPKVGKSWLSMSLAAKVAGAGGTWLGREVMKAGRVLYVDEENPEDVVHNRLVRLGLTPELSSNVRYLLMQGVRLDRYPEKILDEALAFDPVLIVLDSLTRLHTQDENNAGQIAKVFNDGINPLAHKTGAFVLLLHHVNKTDSASSFHRARGSSDIGASVDTGLDVRKVGQKIHVVHYASRRREAGDVIQAQVVDTPGGGVDIVTAANPVF